MQLRRGAATCIRGLSPPQGAAGAGYPYRPAAVNGKRLSHFLTQIDSRMRRGAGNLKLGVLTFQASWCRATGTQGPGRIPRAVWIPRPGPQLFSDLETTDPAGASVPSSRRAAAAALASELPL